MAKQSTMFGDPQPVTAGTKHVGERVTALLQDDPTLADDDWRLVIAYWQKHCRLAYWLGFPELDGSAVVKRLLEFVTRPDVPSFATIVRRRRERRDRFRASRAVEQYRLRKGRQL